MRGVESLMLAGLVVLLGLGVCQGRRWLPNLLSGAAHSPVTATTNSSQKTGPEHTAKKSAHISGKAKKLDAATAGPFPLALETATTLVVPLPSIPRAANIKTGTTKTELRDRYGDPSLNISARQNGRLVERFYYLSSDETQLTVATLQDGIVTSAETVSR